MNKFEVIFYTNIVNGYKNDFKRIFFYRDYEGESYDVILKKVQINLADSNWITSRIDDHYRTSCITNFNIRDLGLVEEEK